MLEYRNPARFHFSTVGSLSSDNIVCKYAWIVCKYERNCLKMSHLARILDSRIPGFCNPALDCQPQKTINLSKSMRLTEESYF